MISVLILTKNESQDLPGCLESVAWADDIHVFDSCSTDATLSIAEAAGATITQRAFDNWSDHQNWGLRNIPFKHPWVLYVDADERVTLRLRESMRQAVRDPGLNVAYLIQRRDFLYQRWLKHVQATSLYARLFQPERISYQRLVNPLSVIDGPVGRLDGYLEHYPFSKGFEHWLARHNGYSTLEAQQIFSSRSGKKSARIGKAIFSSDPVERRFHQKELFYRSPCRPLLKFCLLYILKRGFLDGCGGLTYAMLQSVYEYMIVLKTRELTAVARSECQNSDHANANPEITL